MMWATILILSVLQEKVETRDLYLLHGDFCGIILSIHDLTRRSTAGTEHYCDRRDPFNSRPHTEVDSPEAARSIYGVSFNSRPHTEVDKKLILKVAKKNRLSTHDLTRRSTRAAGKFILNFLSFNSRPHTEVDMLSRKSFDRIILSTHDLTRRST